jgi:hypothetical protein
MLQPKYVTVFPHKNLKLRLKRDYEAVANCMKICRWPEFYQADFDQWIPVENDIKQKTLIK